MFAACCAHGRRSRAACAPSPTSWPRMTSGNQQFRQHLHACSHTGYVPQIAAVASHSHKLDQFRTAVKQAGEPAEDRRGACRAGCAPRSCTEGLATHQTGDGAAAVLAAMCISSITNGTQTRHVFTPFEGELVRACYPAQVSMEAHDSGGRLPEVLRILREDANFDISAVEQSDMLKGSSLYNIYCTRTQ